MGHRYEVPYITVSDHVHGFAPCQRIPVMGPKHEDRDIIGFPDDHWHIDWRFVGETVWSRSCTWNEYRKAYPDQDGIQLAKIVAKANKFVNEGRAVFRCRRPFPVFPLGAQGQENPWLRKLEDAYAHASAKCGRCPHRGISLAGAPVENGARVCPGHGLAYSVETGKLVRRS